MFLQNLSVLNFKNYVEAELMFTNKVICFTGNNGAGKTNLLDAIHYLCLCKSYFNPADSQQILHDEEFFMVQGTFKRLAGVEAIHIGMKRNQRKQVKRNKKEYATLAEHIGQFPLVISSPSDSMLITEGSEERRRFLDAALSQTDEHYLQTLIVYNKVLLNRNLLLKQMHERRNFDPIMLEVYDEQLIDTGNEIFDKRKSYLKDFTEIFNEFYRFLSGNKEKVELIYESQLIDQDFSTQLKAAVDKDRMVQRSTVGIHKDDLAFTIGGKPLKRFGSQGQQKSFLLAMKLAQYHFLKIEKGFAPLLLLDDLFDKLDYNRIKNLLELVLKENFGQLFITDTQAERVLEIFNSLKITPQMFSVADGAIELLNVD